MVLYSWIKANDNQLIYKKLKPHLAYSVDHGHFFPNGPNWTIETLRANKNNIELDSWFLQCGLSETSMYQARDNLMTIKDEDIKLVVDSPPDEWGITEDERIELSDYLISRKQKLIEMLSDN